MKIIKIIFLILFVIHCGTVDIKQLQQTEKDKEKLLEFDLNRIELKKTSVKIQSSSRSSLNNYFGSSFKKATEDLLSNLGGVTVVTKHEDWSAQYKKEEENYKKYLNEINLLQLDDTKDQEKKREISIKFKPKFSAWYEIKAELINGTHRVKYSPPREVKDQKGNVSMTEPSWSATVTAYIYFKVTSTQPGHEKKVVLIRNINNSYSKSFNHNPNNQEIFELYPNAITYCYEDIREELQELLPLNTYIVDLREEKKYAKILGGKDFDIKPGRVFEIQSKGIVETLDGPRELIYPVGKVKIFEVSDKESWGTISGDIESIKLGMELMILPEKRTMLDKIWRLIKSNIGL